MSTVTQEKGKTDKVASGAGTVTVKPEGEGDTKKKHAKGPRGQLHENARDGWINGQPATKDEIEESMR